MRPLDVAALRALLARADALYPAPWGLEADAIGTPNGLMMTARGDCLGDCAPSVCELVVALRNAMPATLDELEETRAALRNVVEAWAAGDKEGTYFDGLRFYEALGAAHVLLGGGKAP